MPGDLPGLLSILTAPFITWWRPLALPSVENRPSQSERCKAIEQATIAAKKDAAYLEGQDNTAADYQTSILPHRPISTPLAFQQTQTLQRRRTELSQFPNYDADENDVCLITDPSISPEMPKLAEKGFDAWKPLDTLTRPPRSNLNARCTHLPQNSLLKSAKRKRAEESDYLIYGSVKSQRRAASTPGIKSDLNAMRKQTNVSVELDRVFDDSVWDVENDNVRQDSHFSTTGHVTTEIMNASPQSHEYMPKRHVTALGSVNEYMAMESIVDVHSKYFENHRRDDSRRCDGQLQNSVSNGVAKGMAAGSSRTFKVSQPAQPVPTYAVNDAMEVDAQQARGDYNTATTHRSGKAIYQKHMEPERADEISGCEEHEKPLRHSKGRPAISAAQQIRDLVALNVPQDDKLTRRLLMKEGRKSPKLSQKFIRDDAEQQKTHLPSTQQNPLDDFSDELSRGSPYFSQSRPQHVKVTPEYKRYIELDRHRTEIGNRALHESDSDDLHSRDIPGTKFVRLTGASQQPKSAYGNGCEPEAQDLRQRYRLCFFNCHNVTILDSKELTIESDKASGCFPVCAGGTKVFTILPKEVHKIDMSCEMGRDGKQVRLLGSKREVGGQYIVHMSFAHEDEFRKFATDFEEVTKGTLSPKWRTDVEMSKIRKQWSKDRDQARSNLESSYAADELALLSPPAKQRQEQSTYQTAIHKPIAPKVVAQMQPESGTSRSAAMSRGQSASIGQNRIMYDAPPDREHLIGERLEHNIRSSARISTRHTTRAPKSGPIPTTKFSEMHGLGLPWEQPVVYPPGGSNKITVDFEDLSRLDDGEFLNDSLVSFCLRYFQSLNPKTENNVHLFNTYFYANLTKHAKSKKGINYDLVKRWTSKLDLFGKDYVIVPINENLHWYVAIICNLRNIEVDFHNENPEIFTDTIIPTTIDATVASSSGRTPSPDLLSGSPQEFQKNYMRLVAPTDIAGEKLLAGQTLRLSLSEKDGCNAGVREVRNLQSVAEPPGGNDHGIEMDVKSYGGTKAAASLQDEGARNTPKKKASRKFLGGRKYDPNQPIIITLDSFGLSHSAAVRNLKDYISEEGKTKRRMEANISAGLTAKGIPLQENYCDCGLYVVGYIKKFLEDPATFVRKVLQKEMNEETDWPEFSASTMRAEIRNILQDQYRTQALQRAGSDKDVISLGAVKGNTAGLRARHIEQTPSEKLRQYQIGGYTSTSFDKKSPSPEHPVPVPRSWRRSWSTDMDLADGRDAVDFSGLPNDMLYEPEDISDYLATEKTVECVTHTESWEDMGKNQSWLDQLNISASFI